MQQGSTKIKAKDAAIEDIVAKKAEQEKKATRDRLKSLEEESGLIVHFGFDDLLCDELPPGYSELSMAVDEASHSCVPNVR